VARRQILHIRHSSLYAPRDFDISPFFQVVKPTIEAGFDYKELYWGDLSVQPHVSPTDWRKKLEQAVISDSRTSPAAWQRLTR
jgi:hypothetical protein